MKKCKFCAEEIQDDAKKCRFCGEWIEEKSQKIVPEKGVKMKKVNKRPLWKTVSIWIIGAWAILTLAVGFIELFMFLTVGLDIDFYDIFVWILAGVVLLKLKNINIKIELTKHWHYFVSLMGILIITSFMPESFIVDAILGFLLLGIIVMWIGFASSKKKEVKNESE